jgi:Prophage CP4-57 regulatory protein (AlpA)
MEVKAVPTKRFVGYSKLPDYGIPEYSRKHLLDLQRRGQFPKAYQLSPNRIGWLEDEILAWAASRPVARAVAELPEDPPVARSVMQADVGSVPPRFTRGPRAGGGIGDVGVPPLDEAAE